MVLQATSQTFNCRTAPICDRSLRIRGDISSNPNLRKGLTISLSVWRQAAVTHPGGYCVHTLSTFLPGFV